MRAALEYLDVIVEAARAGFERLVPAVRALSDDDLRGSSLLPGWTRGHLAAHIARNADSHVRLLEAAQAGEMIEQYPGGQDGRAEEIERGSARPAAEIADDVETSGRALFEVWASLPGGVWERVVRTNKGDHPAWMTAWSRLREIEIHHVDLDVGYSPGDWPRSFLDAIATDATRGLENRLPPNTAVRLRASEAWTHEAGDGDAVEITGTKAGLVAWLLGRPTVSDAEVVAPAGAALPSLASWG